MNSPWLLPMLRERTRDLHERIEKRLRLPDSIQTRGEYTRLLAAFYGYYLPVEKLLTEHAGVVQDTGICLQERLKAGLLEKDLCFLGYSDAALTGIPVCKTIPQLNSVASVLGCAYVLEGATLGGQIIGRALESRLNITQEMGLSFFYCYGEAKAAMWQQFRRASEAYAERETVRGNGQRIAEDAIDAARQTFLSLEQWLLQKEERTLPHAEFRTA